MFLAIDIGNSSIKCALYDKEKLVKLDRFSHNEIEKIGSLDSDFQHCAYSSVVPSLNAKLEDLFWGNFGIRPYQITRDSKRNLLLDYETPQTLGIDRICAAEGVIYSSEINSKNIVIVDFGTATTLNFVENGNTFAGGYIFPGLSTMVQSLESRTAQLPDADLNQLQISKGKSTTKSILAGITLSTVGAISLALEKLNNFDEKFQLVLTGGNADKIAPFIEQNYIIVPVLTLIGIRKIYYKNL